jgi:CDP-paratose 2-epimerase
MRALVTGSAGLVGSAAVEFYAGLGWDVSGIDNNMRRVFFGEPGDTNWNRRRLEASIPRYTHYDIDIRDDAALDRLFADQRFDLVIHCAAQPSHDKARDIPRVDFAINATGTLNLLESTRERCPEAIFIFVSTNKVYGDAPNDVPLVELETRWEYARPEDHDGIDEGCRIDRSRHSLFGVSKLAGDVLAQEYGRYFGMPVGIFRCGCLTGARHSGVELHGFLSYLVKAALNHVPYTIYGYKAKQVRDNLHAIDVVRAFDAFRNAPRPGEVYNLGGGRRNSISILEAIDRVETLSGVRLQYQYRDEPRIGDHICYISNLGKLRRDYPGWDVQLGIDDILGEMIATERSRALSRA